MFGHLFRQKQQNPEPEPLSQEVLERIVAQYPEAERAEVAQVLLRYRVVPVNFGRMRMLDAAKGQAADLPRLVECGNRYGQGWVMNDERAKRQIDRDLETA